MAFLQHHFGSSVSKGAGHRIQHGIARIQHFCNAKVGQDERRVGVRSEVEEILRFQIWRQPVSGWGGGGSCRGRAVQTSVDDVVVVQVTDGFQDLPDDLGSILFGKLAVFADAVKELAAGSQLGDNVVLVLWRG